MPFSIWSVSLWPVHGHLKSAVCDALTTAGATCPEGETWSASVYEGREIGGTQLTLRGSAEKGLLLSGWSYQGQDFETFVYSRQSISAEYRSEADWIQREFGDAVEAFLKVK